jgi:hypothetical protein
MEPATLFRDKSPFEQRALTVFPAEMIPGKKQIGATSLPASTPASERLPAD